MKLEAFRFREKALLKDDLGQLYLLALKLLLETTVQVTNTNNMAALCVRDIGLPGSWYNRRRTAVEWGRLHGEIGVKSAVLSASCNHQCWANNNLE